MDGWKENQHVFSIKLVELLGLRKILDPDTVKFCGYNAFHVAIAVSCAFILSVMSLFPIGFYNIRNDVAASFFYTGATENFLFAMYKIANFVYHSKDLWKCLTNTNLTAFAYRRHSTTIILNSWRRRTSRVSLLYHVLVFISLTSWVLFAVVNNRTLIMVKKPDGSYNQYRMNVGNFFFFLSGETYNRHFLTFFVVELILYLVYFYFSLIFDIYLTMVCFSLSFQLDVISRAVETLGHETRSDDGHCLGT